MNLELEPEDTKAVEALINWLRSQDIGPTQGIPILAAAIVVGVVSHAKQKKWNRQQTYESVVLAAQCVVETYQAMWEEGKKKK